MQNHIRQSLSLLLIGMTLLYSPLTFAARSSATLRGKTVASSSSLRGVGSASKNYAAQQCRGTRVYFNGRCRTVTWFQNNMAVSGRDLLFVMGTTLKNIGDDPVVLVEQTAPGTIEYTIIESNPLSGGGFARVLAGPVRNGHSIRSQTTVDYSYDSNDDLVLYTETQVPKLTLGTFGGTFGGSGWAWETTDWKRTTFKSSTHREICDEDGCAVWIASASADWSCEKLFDAAYASAANECAAGLATAAALVGVSAAAAAVVVTGGFAVLFTPAAGIVAGGSVTTMGGAIAYVCNNSATEAATQSVLEDGCIDVGDAPGGGGILPGDDEPGGDGSGAGAGCMECDEWGEEGFDTGHWDADTGTYTVTHHTETVCTEWSVDPAGEDSDGDGWCD